MKVTIYEALHVAGGPAAELRLRARDIGPSFPALAVPLLAYRDGGRRQARRALTDGIGLLLSASALPLRSASYAALLGGGGSALYSLYVFAVFLLQPHVAPGWTTLSLQLSGTLFVFSIVLLFLTDRCTTPRALAAGLLNHVVPEAEIDAFTIKKPSFTTCATAGWSIRISSTSRGLIFSPPRLMISFSRPVSVT